MATTQPIALPAPNPDNNTDYTMGSYNGDHGGPFNPASYTRHFLGSPISWRAGSFGARFPQGSPSAHLFSSLDHPKSSVDEVSVMNAFNVFDREGELCRNYNCCGIHLPDLHALLEHFEEVHVLVVDPAVPAQISVPFNPQPLDNQPQFDSDDMELELDLDNSTQPSTRPSPAETSPPHTPSNPALAHFAHQYQYTSPYPSRPPSPSHPQVHFPNGLASANPSLMTHPEDAFNPYARFSADYSSHMPGTQYNPSGGEEIVTNDYYNQAPPQQGQCIPPALLFSSSNSPDAPQAKLKLKVRGAQISASTPTTPSTTTPSSTPFAPAPQNTSSNTPSSTLASTPASTPAHTPLSAAPSLLLSKPFRCPKPNCNKSYKQANGLKYHMTHGSCNFAPPKDLEHVKDLLERKRREREANAGLSRSASLGAVSRTADSTTGEPFLQGLSHTAYGDLGAITETELREVEREAEKRVRPFACGVGDCQRRYKNMNGLRYHYQHSGDHGAVGLALLAGGLHECLGNNNHGSHANGNQTNGEKKDEREREREREREGRRRAGGVQRLGGSIMRGGSVSVPVSRATSVAANSRVGTPAPTPLSIGGIGIGATTMQKSVSASVYPTSSSSTLTSALTPSPLNTATSTPNTSTPGETTPFTPGYTNPAVANAIGVAAATHSDLLMHQHQMARSGSHSPPHSSNGSPPLTPLTAAVQGMGLSGGAMSKPNSPTRSASGFGQQQQQVNGNGQMQNGAAATYQAQFVEHQRRQYLLQQQQFAAQAQQQAQQQAAAQQQAQYQAQQAQFAAAQAQQQQQQQQQQAQQQQQQQQQYMMGDADARAQEEFVEAQRREMFQQMMV